MESDFKKQINNEVFGIPCENCGRKIKVRVGELRHSPTLTCSCGAKLIIDSGQANRILSKLEKDFADLHRQLKKTFNIKLG